LAVLIDTSVLVNVERRRLSLERAVGERERAISVITASELLHGVHRATDDRLRARRQAFVEYLISSIEPLPITITVARAHAAGIEPAVLAEAALAFDLDRPADLARARELLAA